MARRFGGTYSPDGAASPPRAGGKTPAGRSAPDVVPPRRMVFRTNLLFVLSVPFALGAFVQDAVGLALHLVAFAMMLGSAVLTREGIRAEDAFRARAIARPPALPRKMLGAMAAGGAVGLSAIDTDAGLLGPLLLGLVATGLHVASFGPDPLRAKGIADAGVHGERVSRAVDEAEAILMDIQTAIRPLRDRNLSDVVAHFAATAREMCRAVEMDPRDLTGARRYLGVYLQGARDATRKFVDFYARTGDDAARRDYESLLRDLSASYAERTRKMLDGDRLDLDVEIGVLRDRLSGEMPRQEPQPPRETLAAQTQTAQTQTAASRTHAAPASATSRSGAPVRKEDHER